MFSTVNKQAVVIPNLRLFSNWFVEGTKDPVHYMFNPSMNYGICASDNLSCAVVMINGLYTKFPGSRRNWNLVCIFLVREAKGLLVL